MAPAFQAENVTYQLEDGTSNVAGHQLFAETTHCVLGFLEPLAGKE
jgi:hypothetical protein